MDFVELLFGISPDGGCGTFEILLITISLAGLLLLTAVDPSANELIKNLGKPGQLPGACEKDAND
jgi:hypothetical protein